MTHKLLSVIVTIGICASIASSEGPPGTGTTRRITLQEAVGLALKHNHSVLIADYAVEEKQHAKEVAKSSYFPYIRNDSSFLHVTDTQLIEIQAGSLGTQIPPVNSIINQGGRNLTTSGTQLTQPLTSMLKIKRANEMAQAELNASRQKAQLAGNDVALAVHQVYYKILIAQAHRDATERRINASQDLQGERIQQVKFGSVLEQELIESRAQLLQAKQELLTTDLELSDLRLKLNDLIGLPLTSPLDLDPPATALQEPCRREECVAAATASHPEIVAARAEVEKAKAAVRLAKADANIPDVEAFARYSYTNDVPFVAKNFGSFGVHLGYDLFDAGRKRSLVRERESQLSQANENLARLTDEVELLVQTAYNKLQRTQQMLRVSEEVLALRTESNRVLQQELLQGAALNSQADAATAQQYEAKALVLQSQMDYLLAHDELIHAIGRTPD